ncbi:hypothetical protein [Halarsenatibacter silvermanii]|uniref:Uncharacterized protein n=1 Tax=Halarsenatibacter silvermanii TaxID=321763 RepID=A0A1G9RBG7_9FIRM|nr:hypothetical protein [Halarsenatibacter silvermanii]SDM20606.1 hypothetical protein SAMN04488692_12128 [Halarsenatibacter silvermanii]
MNKVEKLRVLIWDKCEEVFSDKELEEFLSERGGNVYQTAAFCLNIVLANPERISSYKRGGVSVTKADITAAIKEYKIMGRKAGGFYTINSEKVYGDGINTDR